MRVADSTYIWERNPELQKNLNPATNLGRTYRLLKCTPAITDLPENHIATLYLQANTSVCCSQRMIIESIRLGEFLLT